MNTKHKKEGQTSFIDAKREERFVSKWNGKMRPKSSLTWTYSPMRRNTESKVKLIIMIDTQMLKTSKYTKFEPQKQNKLNLYKELKRRTSREKMKRQTSCQALGR